MREGARGPPVREQVSFGRETPTGVTHLNAYDQDVPRREETRYRCLACDPHEEQEQEQHGAGEGEKGQGDDQVVLLLIRVEGGRNAGHEDGTCGT